MTTKPNDGGPAYPIHIPAGSGCGPHIHEGMTLRDHFAGLAMQGLLSMHANHPNQHYGDAPEPVYISRFHDAARHSYAIAAAMLAEREKGGAE